MDNNYVNAYIETMRNSLIDAISANIALSTQLKLATKEIEELKAALQAQEDLKAGNKPAKKAAE
jgi:hypothetical protein